MTALIRINKYLRDKGFASRREVDAMITSGVVFINGKRAELGSMVGEKDKVEIRQKVKKNYLYYAYYKPRGLSTQSEGGEESVISLWRKEGVYPVGRLDKESEGLMILTNDGRVTTKLLGEDSTHEKEYLVNTKEDIRRGIPDILAKGMSTSSLGMLLPAQSKIVDKNNIRIILKEGKKHQVRIMLSDLGLAVKSLKRVRFGNIKISRLRPGQARPLNEEEVAGLFE